MLVQGHEAESQMRVSNKDECLHSLFQLESIFLSFVMRGTGSMVVLKSN